MQPTREQIAVAAYHRWQRRGCGHGRDQEDWEASARDLYFGLNYRWLVRLGLRPSAGAGPTLLGKPEAQSAPGPRRCRYCERAAPAAPFETRPWAIPPSVGNGALVAWDECDDCHAQFDAHLAGPFDELVGPLLADRPVMPDPAAGVSVPALKALVRMGLAIVPAAELHHFEDTIEWVGNPDAERDAALLTGLGCHVYLTPSPVPAPFASLARRHDDEAAVPYMLFFLGTDRLVLQTHLPFCPRDEDLDDQPEALRGPVLSMSLGAGTELRSSQVAFLPVAPSPVAAPLHEATGARSY